jgi:hypothetical protein
MKPTTLEPPDALLEATRQALTACSEGLDVSAVRRETPLGALIFDSLMAASFIAHLETILQVKDLPFEGWLLSHSERVDALNVGLLVEWLESLPELRALAGRGPPRP